MRTGDRERLSLGWPYRDKAATFGLRLGSASPPGKADKRFRYVQPNMVRYFVIRLGLATYVE
jgi:hypothetical protein